MMTPPQPRPHPAPRRARFASVRWRLTLWYVGMLTAALLVFGGIVYAWQTANLRAEINGEISLLQRQAGDMAETAIAGRAGGDSAWVTVANPTGPGPAAGETGLGVGGDGGPVTVGQGPLPPPPGQPSADVALIVGAQGQILHRTGPIGDADLQKVITQALPTKTWTGGAFSLTQSIDGKAPTSTDYQYYATKIPNGDGTATTIVVGRPNPALGQLRTLTMTLLGAGLAALLVTGAGGYWLATRAMRPVRVITHAAREIGETDLSRRLNLPNQDELGELAATFDSMLARLDEAFRRQRQFTNDASHELRTPLTIVRLETERALASPTLPPEQAQALATVRAETAYMTRLVNDLLTLARADAGQAALERTTVDLSDVALEVVERLAPLAREQGSDVVVGDLPDLPVTGDRLYLTQMLSNLVDNAIKYTGGPGGRVSVETGREPGRPDRGWVRVTDTGPGIPTEHLPHLFDRFYRVDQARTGDAPDDDHPDRVSGGSGLGLAIVQWVARSHGGDVRVESAVGRGSLFEVRLPLAERPLPAALPARTGAAPSPATRACSNEAAPAAVVSPSRRS